MIERRSVVVYYNNENYVRSLAKKDVNIYFICKASQYAILYYDKSREEEIMSILNSTNVITKILKSDIPYEKYSF